VDIIKKDVFKQQHRKDVVVKNGAEKLCEGDCDTVAAVEIIY